MNFPSQIFFNDINHGYRAAILTLFRMGIFGAAHGGGGGQISYDAYPTIMKLGTVILYLKKIQKIYQSRDTPLISANVSIFSPEISKYQEIEI